MYHESMAREHARERMLEADRERMVARIRRERHAERMVRRAERARHRADQAMARALTH